MMNTVVNDEMIPVFFGKNDIITMIKGTSLNEKSSRYLQFEGLRNGGSWCEDQVFDTFDIHHLVEIYKKIQSSSLITVIETIDSLNQIFSTNQSLKFRCDLRKKVKIQQSDTVIKRIQGIIDTIENLIKGGEIKYESDGVIIGKRKTANQSVLLVDDNYDPKQGWVQLYKNDDFSQYIEQRIEKYFSDLFADLGSAEQINEYQMYLLKMINIDLYYNTFDAKNGNYEMSRDALGMKMT